MRMRHDGGHPAAVVYCVCAVYLYCIGSLLAWASLPVLTGMRPTLIISGSMGPAIHAGDVVMMGSPRLDAIRAGSVIMFDDPAHPERLLTHRVVAVNGDGTYRTRGDANGRADSTPVAPDTVRGIGRILVPAVGAPIMWVRTQAWPLLLMWLSGSAFAMGYLGLYGRPRMLVAAWSTALAMPSAPAPANPRKAGRTRGWERPHVRRWRARWVLPTTLVLLALVAVSLPRMASSHAAWSGGTRNEGNAWQASSQFCAAGSRTLVATADARIADGSTTPQGTQTTIGIANKSPATKSVVTFDFSAVAACQITSASLRLQVVTGATGRTLHAWRVSGVWDEASVIWPGPAITTDAPGVASSSATPAAWISFDVTSHALAIRAGTARGLMIQDSSTTGGTSVQTYHSREAAAGKPELVLQVSPMAVPSAPTGLTATASSSTRVALSWTDTTGGVAGFRVERSPGGASNWATVASVPAGSTSYSDTGLEPSTAYDYRIRATSSGGVSAPSNVASATTPAPPAPPSAPTSTTATATGVSTVTVSWADASADEDGFTIQRSPAGAGTWTTAGTVGPNITSFGDTGLAPGTAYDYRVRAHNGGGTSSWSNVATVATDGCATLPAQTLLSEADALVVEGTNAATNFGADGTNFGVRSLNGGNGRSYVRFPAPTVAVGCAVATANLRLRTTTTTTGRTVQVFKVDAAWTEAVVNWNTKPAYSGTPASLTTDAVLGWRQWNVTGLVGAAGTGAANGFLLRDANEGAATAADNAFSPKEGSFRPELVLTFG